MAEVHMYTPPGSTATTPTTTPKLNKFIDEGIAAFGLDGDGIDDREREHIGAMVRTNTKAYLKAYSIAYTPSMMSV